MTDDTEMLIKDALQRQADRAPDGQQVLATLEQRQLRRSPRMLVLATVTAVVVLLVAGTYLVTKPGRGAQEASPRGLPLVYQPHWLPEGLVEKSREIQGRATARVWATGPAMDGYKWGSAGGEVVQLVTEPGGRMPEADGPVARVDINGQEGWLLTSRVTRLPSVVWEARPGTLLTVGVEAMPDASATALRVARSVRPDGTALLDPQISFGALPKGWTAIDLRVSGDNPADASTQLRARVQDVTNTAYHFEVTVALLRSTTQPKPDVNADNVAALPNGDFVQVNMRLPWTGTPTPPMEAMVRTVVHLIRQHPNADVSWVGTP